MQMMEIIFFGIHIKVIVLFTRRNFLQRLKGGQTLEKHTSGSSLDRAKMYARLDSVSTVSAVPLPRASSSTVTVSARRLCATRLDFSMENS